jgi:hypothetical protein
MASTLSGSAACTSSSNTSAPFESSAIRVTSRTTPSSASNRSCASDKPVGAPASTGHSGSTRRRPASNGGSAATSGCTRSQERSASAITLEGD